MLITDEAMGHGPRFHFGGSGLWNFASVRFCCDYCISLTIKPYTSMCFFLILPNLQIGPISILQMTKLRLVEANT